MLKPAHIRSCISGLLLFVFAFSIMPKRFLHDMFAKHIENRHSTNSDKFPYQLANAGYNCDTDNLVAESNFTSNQQVFSFPQFTSFSFYIVRDISFSSTPGIYSSLRGPPAII